MESASSRVTNDRIANGSAASEDRAKLVVGVLAGLVLMTLLYLYGFSRGEILLPALFLGLYVALAVGQVYGNRRRRPKWVEFSTQGLTLHYSSGQTRSIPWDTIASVRRGHFLRDVYIDIRYVDGRVEDKAHIYGEAALELKRRFEELRTTSAS